VKNLKKLRVGIIVDDLDQSYLVYDLYQKSLESDYYSVVSLIIQKPEKKKNFFIDKLINYVKTKGIARLIDRLLFEFINQVETQIIKKKKNLNFFFIIILYQNLIFKKHMFVLKYQLQVYIININL
jgi:hypothetical protein